jgi:hypothetical protein
VQHLRSRIERELTNTDAVMTSTATMEDLLAAEAQPRAADLVGAAS